MSVTKKNSTSPSLTRKQSPLETANEMYKSAFLVKKTKFSKLHPELSEREIEQMTAKYFANLDKE